MSIQEAPSKVRGIYNFTIEQYGTYFAFNNGIVYKGFSSTFLFICRFDD